LEILWHVHVNKSDQKTAAVVNRVSQSYVSRLVKKADDDPGYLDALLQKLDDIDSLNEVIEDLVLVFKLEKKPIHSSKEISSVASKILNKTVKESQVIKIFKSNNNLSYKKTKNTPVDPNLEIHMVKRHHFANEFLNLMT
jgi:hypothetical protein